MMPESFGPLPGGSTILWQTDHFLMYADSKGQEWRYMHEFHARWPVEFVPPINLKRHGHGMEGVAVTKYELSEKEIEDLI
jgi:hypothetical protein